MMFITTQSETKALLLEKNLIKQLKPRYFITINPSPKLAFAAGRTRTLPVEYLERKLVGLGAFLSSFSEEVRAKP